MCQLASVFKKPLFLIEGNASPGFVTKLFAKKARAVFTSSARIAETLPNATLSGIPSRRVSVGSLEKRQGKTVIILGGSCGSAAINNAVLAMLAARPELGFSVVWSAGQKEYISFKNKAIKRKDVELFEYIHNLPATMAGADLVVSRAGAMTVQEIREAGIYAIFVPFAQAAGDHQRHNAEELSSIGMAKIITEAELEAHPKLLLNAIDNYFSKPEKQAKTKDYYAANPTPNRNAAIHGMILERLENK